MKISLPFAFNVTIKRSSPCLPISKIAENLLRAKAHEGRSLRHRDDLRLRIARFVAEAGDRPATDFCAEDFRAWLSSLPLGLRSRNNYARAVEALFRFAKAERALHREWDELHGLRLAKAPPGKANVYGPGELTAIFDAAQKHRQAGARALVPWIALRALAGIRESEMRRGRMSWEAIDFENGFVVMERQITKTATWRRIPISEALREWLLPYASTGNICPVNHPLDIWQEIRDAAHVPALNNALRDSFTTYRLAVLDDPARVSLETGNSPRKIMESYSSARTHDGKLITKELAAAWFDVRPQSTQQKVLKLF